MLGFDFPHHVIELFGRGTVQGRFHTAVGRRDASIRIAGRQCFDRHRPRYVPHFAWALRQGHVSRFRACDRQAYAGRDKRAIVVMHVLPVRRVSNGLRAIIFACGIQVFDALQSRSHARLRLVEQIFRIRSAERLHGFVGIAHQQQARSAIMQGLKQGETSQRRILEIVDDQHVWNIGIPYVRHGLGGVDHQLRRIKTVFAGIGCTNRRIVFLTQREGETPLGAQAFATRVKLAIPAGRAGDEHVFKLRFRTDLVHACKHVSQLVGECVGGIVGHQSGPFGNSEIDAQQIAGGALVAMLPMFHMRCKHLADDHILFGAVQQFRQRFALCGSCGRQQAECDGRQCGDRSSLRNRRQFTDRAIAQHVGDLSAGHRHHGIRITIQLHRGDQHVQRKLGFSTARRSRNQRDVSKIFQIHHASQHY